MLKSLTTRSETMITFYAPNNAWGCFSNFSNHRVSIYRRTWRTSEHPFQAMKYHPHRPDLVQLVYEQPTPGRAARVGRDRSYPLRVDWEMPPDPVAFEEFRNIPQPDDHINRCGVLPEPLFARVKDVFMFEIVRAKFEQNGDIRQTLFSTEDEVLIEDALHDPYWGWGASHVGENKLGRILMAVREQLR